MGKKNACIGLKIYIPAWLNAIAHSRLLISLRESAPQKPGQD
jgi:hypothetical protein